jgi:hypothetical protein
MTQTNDDERAVSRRPACVSARRATPGGGWCRWSVARCALRGESALSVPTGVDMTSDQRGRRSLAAEAIRIRSPSALQRPGARWHRALPCRATDDSGYPNGKVRARPARPMAGTVIRARRMAWRHWLRPDGLMVQVAAAERDRCEARARGPGGGESCPRRARCSGAEAKWRNSDFECCARHLTDNAGSPLQRGIIRVCGQQVRRPGATRRVRGEMGSG